LKIARNTVKQVLQGGTAEVPPLERGSKADEHREPILELYKDCKGNLVRVHEELLAAGLELSYSALTAFCRRHGIGHEPKPPAGQYTFRPGQELQHDTSPHEVKIRGTLHRTQTASAVLCYSRMTFVQLYPRFTRFECKLFLNDAVQYFGGSTEVWMIDNTHVVVLHGTGKDMVPVPEMAALADRFGSQFKAHEKGDANRSARVELSFDHVDNNFLAGREFSDWSHVNREAKIWCDKLNARFSRRLHASRRELFAVEQSHLKPLPIWLPEIYRLHHRIVNLEGYVTVNGVLYSAPYALMGRRLEVRETKDKLELFDGPRLLAVHSRAIDLGTRRVTLPEHRPRRAQGAKAKESSVEEQAILRAAPELKSYLAGLKLRNKAHGVLALRRLLRMLRDYPRDPLLKAVEDAEHYGLYDLERVDRMVLRNIAQDFFPTGEPRNEKTKPDKNDPEGSDDG
jgi:hypothetical protein